VTGADTSGVASGGVTINPTYYHQYLIPASYSVSGGGSPKPPVLRYTSLGAGSSLTLSSSPIAVWMDAGSTSQIDSILVDSGASERWLSQAGPIFVTGTSPIVPEYTHQFYLTVMGTQYPSGWYDARTAASVTARILTPQGADVRSRLSAYSLDGGTAMAVPVLKGNVTVPILMTSHHEIAFSSVTQYRIGFTFTDDSSSVISPSTVTVIVNGAPKPLNGTSIWEDVSSTVQISSVIWGGEEVAHVTDTAITVSAPQNVTVATRVYEPTVEVRDHLGIPVSGATVALTEVNGTVMRMVTDSIGEARFPPIPLGGFTGTVTSLGIATGFLGDAFLKQRNVVVIPWSYPEVGVIAFVVVAFVVVSLAARRKH